MARAKVPAAAELDVVIVNVDDPEPFTEPGAKLAVAPEGNPLTPRFTVPPNPFTEPIVVVNVVLLPAVIV